MDQPLRVLKSSRGSWRMAFGCGPASHATQQCCVQIRPHPTIACCVLCFHLADACRHCYTHALHATAPHRRAPCCSRPSGLPPPSSVRRRSETFRNCGAPAVGIARAATDPLLAALQHTSPACTLLRATHLLDHTGRFTPSCLTHGGHCCGDGPQKPSARAAPRSCSARTPARRACMI